MAGIYSNDSDLKPGSAPVIDPSSPNADDNINPETRTRVNGETGVIPPVDPTINPTNVNLGTEIGTSTSSDSYPDEGATEDRLLFDFEGFLEGDTLGDIFRITPGSASEGAKWEITKFSEE